MEPTAPMQLASWLGCLAFVVWLILLLLKLADRVRGKSPMPPNEQIDQSVAHLAKEHKETRSRVIEIERWRAGLCEELRNNSKEMVDAGSKRETRLMESIEDVRKELHSEIRELQTEVHTMPERIVKLFTNIKDLGGK